ncbi:MAG: sugar transferase [Thermodesulfovibrionales bacterium]|jgi:lipopolysaccharide/colanic/teichoic acid biosynthesis glycosyltransferase
MVSEEKIVSLENAKTVVRRDKYAYCVINYLIDNDSGLYVENYFNEVLSLERKRTERSRNPFLLMTLSIEKVLHNGKKDEFIKRVSKALFSCTREIDIKGWYRYDALIGVIFTEMDNDKSDKDIMKEKVYSRLHHLLSEKELDDIEISFYIFPGEPEKAGSSSSTNMNFYPDVLKKRASRKSFLLIKRSIDIIGSIMALIIFSPFFLIFPLFIKFSSKGPVLFKQERLGLHGKNFTFLKFRSMYVNNNHDIHKEYVKKLIIGKPENDSGGDSIQQSCCYKLRNDPRITPIGRILRKTSLDELPQFLNVLRGDMSLVGPRPPIPYELENYDIWHRRRVLEVKPGITGLWQVHGRSSTTFDEMVRLDLTYVRNRSIWLDIKILLQTPTAVLFGKGAY